ncbi:methyl-accepting chemotaxis protein [Vibrio sp. S12_S33]|uniref:methyl-accepting chemotaxis protein n=1 Tax=Vibrio sp. S12_S33 TaxID=2720223 RepID=UPI00177E24D3|nr:HAMP domain-containing methyl-accepting chemotaxis protein [Vibrio sp. S12_S33]MBD1564034.1 HAMP domain-containing protein [Vibrio sp. S12_S33]
MKFIKKSFKNKIMLSIVLSLSLTIFISYISVNYVISDYIKQNESDNIKHSIALIRNTIETNLNEKIAFIKKLEYNVMGVTKAKENSDFDTVVKVSGDFVLNDTMDLTEQEELYFIDLANKNKANFSLSHVELIEGNPSIIVTIRQSDNSTNFYIYNLARLNNTIESYIFNGSFVELIANDHVIFSNKKHSNTTPIELDIKIEDQLWPLIGYIDNNAIASHVSELNWMVTVALVTAGFVMCIANALVLNFSFKPFIQLNNLVSGLNKGEADLTQRLNVNSKDEVGEISQSINNFIAQLQKIFVDVSNLSQKIDSSVTSLSEQTAQNLSTLHKHTKESELAITAIEELSCSAVAVAQSTNEAAKTTEKTNKQAECSKETVTSAVDSVKDLLNQVSSMSGSISEMAHGTKEIGSILKIIGDIAEQTNLLALNAAIEAARAGEQGRGFAVVADEVRALAARTQESTSKISDMLNKLEETTMNVVSAMDSTRSSCEKTAEHTHQVMDSLNEVTSLVVEINQLNSIVATSSIEQSTVTGEVNQNMHKIQHLIDKLNKNAQDSKGTEIKLSEISNQLNELIARFKF